MTLVVHKYMPEEMPVEELRATFAAREHTLSYLVTALHSQITAKTLTSYLITGPRGAGKTTIVLMTCLSIREDPALSAANAVVPAGCSTRCRRQMLAAKENREARIIIG